MLGTSFRILTSVNFQVFSEDQAGNMDFSDFLDMLSVMSMQAPKDLKDAYAFKVTPKTKILNAPFG